MDGEIDRKKRDREVESYGFQLLNNSNDGSKASKGLSKINSGDVESEY